MCKFVSVGGDTFRKYARSQIPIFSSSTQCSV